MKKLLIVILISITALSIFVYLNFSSFTKKMIEEVASESLGVKVTIAKFDLSLTEKSVTINGIAIANPTGFSDTNALKLNNIKVIWIP